MSILVDLEDQLFQIANESEQLSAASARVVQDQCLSRAHTAQGRLSSLVGSPSYAQADPCQLAELGVLNLLDQNMSNGMRHYQHTQILLESPSNLASQKPQDLITSLDNQLRGDIMRAGFPTWNVTLSKSINAMPPKSHLSGLAQSTPSDVSSVHQLANSDFVLTASKHDASVNLWTTRAGLTGIAAINFKL